MSSTASESHIPEVNHLVTIPNGSLGVIVYFEGTSYRFNKVTPQVRSDREKAILRALLDAALAALDAS